MRNNSLTGADVKNLRTGDISDGSLLAQDFAAGQLPRGEKGETGQPGEPATKLFGYISENGQGGNGAKVEYGSGVTGVTEGMPAGRYQVQFDRPLVNCIVQATAGSGDPPGAVIGADGFADVYMAVGAATTGLVEVTFQDANGAGVDTPFLVAALC